MWKSDCGYSRMYGSSRSIVPGFGLDMSMWHRHTQPLAFSGTSE